MKRFKSTLWAGALVLVWGCAEQSFGDSALCGSSVDAQGELVPDCANPSCQALEACRVLSPTPIGPIAGAKAEAPITNPTQAPAAMPTESPAPVGSVPSPTPTTPPAAQMPPQQQKPDRADCAEKGSCSKDPDCKGDGCELEEALAAISVVITQINVVVPRSLDGGASCLDAGDSCDGYTISPFLQCGCAPNPIVVVNVDGVDVAKTSTSPSSDFASWETEFAFEIGSESTVSLRVFDVDGDHLQEMFGCEIPASSPDLTSGSISCTKQFLSYVGLANYHVTAKFSHSDD